MVSRKGCFDSLPEGWKMEIRYRSTGKSDRFYIDPVSGYAFRSMNEVFRYLDTGKVGRRVHKHKEDKNLMKKKSRNLTLSLTAKTGKPKTRKNSQARKLHLKNQNTESDVEDPQEQTADLQKLASLLPWGSREKRCSEFIFPMVGELVVNLRIEKDPVKITDNNTKHEQMKIIPNHEYEGGGEEEESRDEHEGVHDDLENDDYDVLTWLEEEEQEQEQEHPEINASASEFLCEGLWNDPCIEFAIKTLTGELPIDKDAKNPGSLTEFHDKTGNVVKNKEEEGGGNVVMKMHQKCLTNGLGEGGGLLNWPTFADYSVTNFSWTNSEISKAREF